MPNALVVTSKSLSPRVSSPVELIENQFSVGSLRQSGLADVTTIYWDEYQKRNQRGAEDYIIEYCSTNAPDIVVFGSQPSHYSSFDILRVTKELSSPMVHLWWDHISPSNQRVADAVGERMALNVVMDSELTERNLVFGNYIKSWYPIDGSLYRTVDRDMGISFLGTLNSMLTQRVTCINHLLTAGIDLKLFSGAYSSEPLTLRQYAETLCRTKIALNFTYLDLYKVNQCKSRTFEATCAGAMLLESENEYTPQFFTPYVDYVPFRDADDLQEKAEHYLAHDEERQKIADAGHKKQRELYNETKFWTEIFDLLKIGQSR